MPYQGNSNDVGALVALILGVSSLLACWGFWYILPVVAFLLGLVAWLHARDSIHPRRTRWMAGGAMATGGIFLLLAFGFIMMCMMCYVFMLALPPTRPTFGAPTPFIFSTPTP